MGEGLRRGRRGHCGRGHGGREHGRRHGRRRGSWRRVVGVVSGDMLGGREEAAWFSVKGWRHLFLGECGGVEGGYVGCGRDVLACKVGGRRMGECSSPVLPRNPVRELSAGYPTIKVAE